MKLKNYALLCLVGLLAVTACKKKHTDHPVPVNTTPVQINSFTPETAAKDSIVVIHGSGFGTTPGKVGVTFNGVAATVLVVSDDTILKVKVPIHAGNGKINVQVGSQSGNSATNFTYLYTVTTLAGDGNAGYTPGTTTGSKAKFNLPSGVAVDAAGNVYVADLFNNCIRKITTADEVSTLAGNGTYGYLNTTTAGSPVEFAYPSGVAVDATTGNIYVGDKGNNCIRKVDPVSGAVSTFAGDGNQSGDFTDAIGTDARFIGPRGVAADAAGNIYVADGDNNSIRKIASGGNVITLAGSPSGAEFSAPYGVAADAAGNIYVADLNNNRIRKITSAGGVSTLAGDGTQAFKDGIGTSAEFYSPQGIAVDAAGNIYIADTNNNRIRKITPAGVVTTLAGDDNAAFKDGIGTAAEFYAPRGIAVDAAGNIYVADTGNQCIRKLQ